MKQVSTELAEHLVNETTTLATCWKLSRRDGVVFGFTDHDQNITYDDVIYRASTGFSPGAIDSNAALSVDNLDIEGMLSDNSISEPDILAGKYDFAEIEIFQVNYENPGQGAIKLKRGWLGEVTVLKQQFIAEVRGLTQKLSQTIGELYSASCRATLGDGRCKVNLEEHTVTGEITSVTSSQEFQDSARDEATGIFTFGKITFTSGANDGLSMEVKEYLLTADGAGRFILALPMPYVIGAGDTYSLSKGCDKTVRTCFSRFDNVVNFRGEPSVPGLDRMLETAGTRSVW